MSLALLSNNSKVFYNFLVPRLEKFNSMHVFFRITVKLLILSRSSLLGSVSLGRFIIELCIESWKHNGNMRNAKFPQLSILAVLQRNTSQSIIVVN